MSFLGKLRAARTEKKLLKDVEKEAFDQKYETLKADAFLKRVEEAKTKGLKRAEVKSNISTTGSVMKTAKTAGDVTGKILKTAGKFVESIDKNLDKMVDESPKKKTKKKGGK